MTKLRTIDMTTLRTTVMARSTTTVMIKDRRLIHLSFSFEQVKPVVDGLKYQLMGCRRVKQLRSKSFQNHRLCQLCLENGFLNVYVILHKALSRPIVTPISRTNICNQVH